MHDSQCAITVREHTQDRPLSPPINAHAGAVTRRGTLWAANLQFPQAAGETPRSRVRASCTRSPTPPQELNRPSAPPCCTSSHLGRRDSERALPHPRAGPTRGAGRGAAGRTTSLTRRAGGGSGVATSSSGQAWPLSSPVELGLTSCRRPQPPSQPPSQPPCTPTSLGHLVWPPRLATSLGHLAGQLSGLQRSPRRAARARGSHRAARPVRGGEVSGGGAPRVARGRGALARDQLFSIRLKLTLISSLRTSVCVWPLSMRSV